MSRTSAVIFLRISLLCGLMALSPATGATQDATGENPELDEASLGLKAAHEAWKHSDEEYRQFCILEGVPEAEVREFAAFVVELKIRAIQNIEVVRELGGDVSQYVATPEKQAGDHEFREEIDGPIAKGPEPISERELTHEEQVDLLEKQLAWVGMTFDEMIRKAQAGTGGVAVNGQSNGGSAGGIGAEPGAQAQQGEGQSEASSGTNENAQPGSGPGVITPDENPDFDIKDIGDGRDDDTIARQLREAAERETDKELKAALWARYLEYKNR